MQAVFGQQYAPGAVFGEQFQEGAVVVPVVSLGGRADWRKYDDLPRLRVSASAPAAMSWGCSGSVSAEVEAERFAEVSAGAEGAMRWGCDVVVSAVVKWERPRLVRSTPALIRSKALEAA
jgi:hypothetical protein